MTQLPLWLHDKLASPPEAGAGVHAWLFSCARQLHAHMDAGEIERTLQRSVENCGRHVPLREIRDAVNNSYAVAWQPKPDLRGGPRRRLRSESENNDTPPASENISYSRWPRADPLARDCRLRDAAAGGVMELYDLWERSPVRMDEDMTWGPDDWLDWLFPEAEWLCLAQSHPAEARTRKREKWLFGAADNCGLIVPSPMTGPHGKRQDGKRSPRCLDNTGPRRWLIIEFDNCSADEQAALLWVMGINSSAAGWPALRLVVHSGGKSLHGWFGPCNDEEVSRELMAFAISFGADPATWNRCQLVRLPGGRRKEGVEQTVHYFSPF